MPLWNIDRARIQQFKVFREVFEQGSLSDTADTLGMTQSAVSKQLTSLRQYFGDDLFVRTAARMEPTVKAASIADNIRRILDEVDALAGEAEFTPADLKMRCVISTTDEIQYFLLPDLLRRLETEAPHVQLQFKPLGPDYAVRELEAGSVSMVISVNWTAPEHLMQSLLYEDDFVCLMAKTHLLAKQDLTLSDYVVATHMMVAPLGKVTGRIDDALELEKQRRFIRVTVPNFMQAGTIVEQSDMLVTLPRRVARHLGAHHSVVIRDLPFDVPGLAYYQFWHKRYRKDKARSWLFGLVRSILTG